MDYEADIISEVIGCKNYHKHVPQFVSRAWIAEGKKLEVIYWDKGNGWSEILCILPKECKNHQEKIASFYKKLWRETAKYYKQDDEITQ